MPSEEHTPPHRFSLNGPIQTVLLLVALAMLGAALDLLRGHAASGFEVTFDMSTTTPGIGQVFLSTPSGYTAERSKTFELVQGGQRHRYSVAFPSEPLPARIRLDPGGGVGRVDVHAIRIDADGTSETIEGDTLLRRVSLLNHLSHTKRTAGVVSLQAEGDDPFLDFSVELHRGDGLLRLLAGCAWLLAALGLSGWLVWRNRDAMTRLAHAMTPAQRQSIVTLIACVLAYVLLRGAGYGCERMACSPRGIGYGAAMFAASLVFALVGSSVFRLLNLRGDRGYAFFMSMLAGQAALILYIYIRSLVSAALPMLPLTRLELLLVTAVAAAHLWITREHSATHADSGESRIRTWPLLQLALLALVCIVVADRELPRLAMLSSDPDTHAFLARQLERLGGIYRDQQDWGSEPLTYPAGSASLIFGWASLSFLSIGNALAALPMLLTFVAALAIAESFAHRVMSGWSRALMFVAILGVVASGLAFPIFEQFAHLEGTGRLLSIGATAMLCVLLMRIANSEPEELRRHEWRQAVLVTMALFCLTTLHPVNLVTACLVLAVCLVVVTFRTRRPSWLLAVVPACALLLVMDPYYWALMTGNAAPNKLTLSGHYTRLGPGELIDAWQAALAGPWMPRLLGIGKLMPWHPFPTFAIPAGALVLALLMVRDIDASVVRRWIVIASLLIFSTLLVTAIIEPFAGDVRFYLLPQYFPMIMAQFKALAIIGLGAGAIACCASSKFSRLRILVVAGLAIALVYASVRPAQRMMLTERYDYCGSMGCVQPSDVEVVSRLEVLVADGKIPDVAGALPRVLIPNRPIQAGNESWVFPTGGARYLALADALPVAFFYFQGDADYTTRNYMRHVCNRLDRAWLAKENIRYVFLPAEREGACDGVFDALRTTDRILLQSGNTYLIELRPAQ